MSAAAPNALWYDVALLLREAAYLAGTPSACWPARGRAAQLCRMLASQVAPDEALEASRGFRAPFVDTASLVYSTSRCSPIERRAAEIEERDGKE